MADTIIDKVSVPGFLGRPSTETQSVDITVNGVSFSIPRNFLETAALTTKYGAFFRIAATLPDFSGANSSSVQQFDGHNWWRYPNTIIIAYVQAGDSLNRNQLTLAGAAKGELEDADFGLKLAKGDPRSPNLDVFVNYDENAVVECDHKDLLSSDDSNEVVMPKRCRVWINVADRITFQCEYRREQLSNELVLENRTWC